MQHLLLRTRPLGWQPWPLSRARGGQTSAGAAGEVLGLPQRAFAPGGWDFPKGLGGTSELVASLDRGVSPLRVMGGHCRVSPQGCPQHLITQTHGKNLGLLSAVGTSRGRDRTCPRLVFPPCSLVPSLLPPCPHSFVLTPTHPHP